ncbi:Lsr2 family DNA-binding protein [Streptomyces noursei]|uniref:Lsr2 family DNA-binding protein n=1 Tax=Streptomyces noursei TaxID=1971 RepID=UPI003F4CC4C6
MIPRDGHGFPEPDKIIRAWARENGWPKLPAQGRVPTNVRHAYELAHREPVQGKAVAA